MRIYISVIGAILITTIGLLTCSSGIDNSVNNQIIISTNGGTSSIGGVSFNPGSSTAGNESIGGTGEFGGNTTQESGGSSSIGGQSESGGTSSLGGETFIIPTLGGSGTLDPEGVGGEIIGDTEDPIIGDTNDPPEGDTNDPPEGDTNDPGMGDTNDPPDGDSVDPPEGDTNDPPVIECIPTEISNINVIVFEDASPSGADSEGRMYVGNDLIAEGYGIASKDNVGCNSDDYSLVVGGDVILRGGSIGNGRIAYGGDATLENFTAPCGSWKFPDSIDAPVDFEELKNTLKGYSIAFTQYPINGTVTSSLILTGTDTILNVFSITGEQLESANQITIIAPGESSVIVNVSGLEINWGGAGFILPDGGASCRGDTSTWCHRILWNLYEATILNISGIGIQGSVLAPYATLDGGGGNVDGQVIVEFLYGSIEYHPYFFSGCLKLPIQL